MKKVMYEKLLVQPCALFLTVEKRNTPRIVTVGHSYSVAHVRFVATVFSLQCYKIQEGNSYIDTELNSHSIMSTSARRRLLRDFKR